MRTSSVRESTNSAARVPNAADMVEKALRVSRPMNELLLAERWLMFDRFDLRYVEGLEQTEAEQFGRLVDCPVLFEHFF